MKVATDQLHRRYQDLSPLLSEALFAALEMAQDLYRFSIEQKLACSMGCNDRLDGRR